MARTVIALKSEPAALAIPAARADSGPLADTRGRALHDLRISVTDRCNFRCTYCMPKEVFGPDYPYLPHAEVLTFEEIVRVARVFAGHGVRKIRLTGGEPLLRKDIERLVRQLRDALPEVDLTLTTNGSALKAKAAALKAAGLDRISVSLDSLDDATFRAMNDADFPVARVLEGIDAAARAGLAPVKINMVVKRGVNDRQVLDMARRFRGTGHVVRFIEFMDVGSTNGWRMDDVVPSAQIVRLVSSVHPLEPVEADYEGEVAERWRYADGAGEIGVIASVTQAFCASCTRARLSTHGHVYTCLFSQQGYDLKSLLRGGADDATLAQAVAGIWQARTDRYSEIRTAESARTRKVEMSFIGG
ncbi:MAG TPA: GTP 3',8-cyclase MoaA [Usitatibacter sp.]|jgi:cyclic pyranopterin phosphate synthase|nr:GTP 3',8-cyclase MoaA [Usitatibacter sp.]